MTADNITTLPHPFLTVTPTWKQFSIDLNGGDTGTSLYSGFSWVHHDPGRPITFYLDNIVWDEVGQLPPAIPAGAKNGTRDSVFTNNCKETVWVGFTTRPARRSARAGSSSTLARPSG